MTVESAEAALLDRFASDNEAEAVFILGAPRTGSTVLYQAVAHAFGLPFISNLTNDFFATAPVVGVAISNGVNEPIGFESRYGKAPGLFQPSEGSAVMAHWFGGGHPSQSVSARILPGRESHLLRTLSAVHGLTAKPLLIKNAWNCFRIENLARMLPAARFIWARRDIAAAAGSDLEARRTVQGSENVWNSATPANIESLQKLPPPLQVVENQYEFNRAIAAGLSAFAAGRWCEVWYEDFARASAQSLSMIAERLRLSQDAQRELPRIAPARQAEDRSAGQIAIATYVAKNRARMQDHIYRGNQDARR